VVDLLKDGPLMDCPLIVTFYRGYWCPYIATSPCEHCRNTFQNSEPKGANLVAISPQLSDFTKDIVKENKIDFPVLSDVELKVRKECGID
jgi:peroxiredoxin